MIEQLAIEGSIHTLMEAPAEPEFPDLNDAPAARRRLLWQLERSQAVGITEAFRIERDAARSLRALIRELRSGLIEQMARHSDDSIEMARLRAIRASLRDAVDGLTVKAAGVLDEASRQAYRTADEAVGPLAMLMPGRQSWDEVNAAALKALSVFTTESLTNGLGSFTKQQLWRIISQVTMGIITPNEGITRVGSSIDRGTFKRITSRAEAIVRTETLRAYSVAQDLRMRQATQAGLTIRKRWDAAGDDDRTRPSHVAADGQTVDYNERFTVAGEQLRYPRDPIASAKETINCRCIMIAIPVL